MTSRVHEAFPFVNTNNTSDYKLKFPKLLSNKSPQQYTDIDYDRTHPKQNVPFMFNKT